MMLVNFKMMKFNGLWSLLRYSCFNPNVNVHPEL